MNTYQQQLDKQKQRIRLALERQREMARLYREGKSMQEIGDMYGLTRARVSQILQIMVKKSRGGAK